MALALAVGKANEECAPYRSIGTQVTKSKQEQQEKSSLDYQTKGLPLPVVLSGRVQTN